MRYVGVAVAIILVFVSQNNIGIHAQDCNESESYCKFDFPAYYEFHGHVICNTDAGLSKDCIIILKESGGISDRNLFETSVDENGYFVVKIQTDLDGVMSPLKLYLDFECCSYSDNQVTNSMLKNYTSSDSSKPVVMQYSVHNGEKVYAKEIWWTTGK